MLVRGKFFWGNDAGGREDWAPGACQRYDKGGFTYLDISTVPDKLQKPFR